MAFQVEGYCSSTPNAAMRQRLHKALLLALPLLLLLVTTCNAVGRNSADPRAGSNREDSSFSAGTLWSWSSPHVLQEEDASPIHDRQKEEKLFTQWEVAKLVVDTGEAALSGNAYKAEDILDVERTQQHFSDAHRQVKELLSQHEQSVIRDAIQQRVALIRSLQVQEKPVPALQDTLEIPVLVEINVFVDLYDLLWIKGLHHGSGNRQLERHLQALSREKSFVHVINSASERTHKLPVSIKYSFNVNTVSKDLESTVTRIVRTSVDGSNKTHGGVTYIDVNAVDAVIRADHVDSHGKTSLSTSYSIYLFGGNSGNRPIAEYLYTSKDEECGFQLWKGQDRYVFVDLSATVLETGPRLNGRGIVVPEILPQWPRSGESQERSNPSPVFYSKLAALVSHILSHIVFPSLHQLPFIGASTEIEAKSQPETLIQVFHVGNKRKLSKVYSSVTEHLKRLPSLALENIVFAKDAKVISYETCNLCAVALVDAVRHRSVRRTAGSAPIAYGSYLNSSVLSEHIRRFKDRIVRASLGTSSLSQRILPVFVLETDGMLLDDEYLAMAFSDFVLGVSISPDEIWTTNLQCPRLSSLTNEPVSPLESSGKRLGVDLFDAILKSGWGVSSYHERWCPIRNETVTNHLFGVRKTDLVSKAVEINDVVAATASAPLLGFSAKDSAVRNLELAQVIAALEDIQKTNAHLEWYRKVRGVDMFYGKQSALLEMFAECECVQSHALDQIGKLFALHDYEHARHYLNVLAKAAHASRLLVLHTASRYKPPETDCFT